MSMLDSEPVFETRMMSTGLSMATIQAFKDQGITTMARLAYSSASQPGQDETAFIAMVCKVLKANAGEDIDVGTLSSIRRCWWESHTVAVSQIRQSVERTDNAEPVKMPMPERESRMKELLRRFPGISFTAQVEPSHQLIDFCNQLRTDEQLRYICPTKCTSRDQEIRGIKKDPQLKSSADGTIKLVNQEMILNADLGGEYRVRMALQRRSIALDIVKLATYPVMEAYHDFLFNMLLRDVPDTHDRIHIAQLLKADESVFVKMIELCRGGISQKADGSYPIEMATREAQRDPVVLANLQPLPKSQSYKRTEAQSNSQASHPYPAQSSGNGGKGRGKGKGKNQTKGFAFAGVPKELEGMKTRTKNGNPICFAANLDQGCPNAKWGQRCAKGIHVCMKCGGHHACTSNSCKPKA
jgi:hypothetical protein